MSSKSNQERAKTVDQIYGYASAGLSFRQMGFALEMRCAMKKNLDHLVKVLSLSQQQKKLDGGHLFNYSDWGWQ